MDNLFIGPAGWSYSDWKSVVFPDGKRVDALKFISAYFDTVEINSSFYAIPHLKYVRSWIDRVKDNKNFLFTIKLYRNITHEPQLLTEYDIKRMLEVIDLLMENGCLGSILAQFPYKFHQTEENRKYLVKIRKWFSERPFAVEFRHRSWWNKKILEFLTSLDIALCNIDQPRVSYYFPLTDVVTIPSFSYLRCHGRNAEDWFGEHTDRDKRYNYRYSREELLELASVAKSLASKANKVFVIFNNHFRGSAVFNAMEFCEIVGFRGKPWPLSWIIKN